MSEKTGKWIMVSRKAARCSVCGSVEFTNGMDFTMSGCIFKAVKHYCYNCGAKMEGVEKDDKKGVQHFCDGFEDILSERGRKAPAE